MILLLSPSILAREELATKLESMGMGYFEVDTLIQKVQSLRLQGQVTVTTPEEVVALTTIEPEAVACPNGSGYRLSLPVES